MNIARFDLLLAHGKPCPYCAREMRVQRKQKLNPSSCHDSPTRDHVIPKSRKSRSMIVIVCRQCNGHKGSLTPEEWLAVLRYRRDRRAEIVERFIRENQSRYRADAA